MNAEFLTVCDNALASVLNGVYQGIILTLLVYLVLRLTGPINAATRYWVWGVSLVLVIGLIPAHYYRNRSAHYAVQLTDTRQDVRPALEPAATPAGLPAGADDPLGEMAESGALMLTEVNLDSGESASASGFRKDQSLLASATTTAADTGAADTGAADTGAADTGAADTGAAAERSHIAAAVDGGTPAGTGSAAAILRPIAWNISSLVGLPRVGSMLILLAWLTVAAIKTGLLFVRLYQIRKVKRAALSAGPELSGLFARLRADLAIRRKVDLKLCSVQASPVALGFLHPVILLPEECASNPVEAEHILRHELAHVRRGDDWANLAQHFIQAGLFFHPAVWWISKRLVLEREIACDDYVLQRGAGRRAYALLLAELAGRLKHRDHIFAQGVSSSKSQLQQRINMILNTRRNTSPGLAKARLGFVTASAGLIALLVLYSAPRVVLAQPRAAAEPVAPASPVPAIVAISAAPASPPLAVVAAAPAALASTPVPPGTPNVGPGPKFKPEPDGMAGLPPAVGNPALVREVPLQLGVVEFAADAHSNPFPQAPGTDVVGGSLEERIARLEKMVQSLMAQPGQKHTFLFRDRVGDRSLQALVDEKELQKINEKMNEMAKRQAERAQEQAIPAEEQSKRAAEQAERANKEFNFKWKAEGEHWQQGTIQLEALRKAREGLERQMEKLNREIERVERDHEKIQEKRRSEFRDEKRKEEGAAGAAENDKN